MYYRPKLANGKFVKPPWTLTFYRLFNKVSWPLEDDVGLWAKIFDRCFWAFGLLLFMLHNDAEFRYLYFSFINYQNIDDLLEGIPTYLILVESILRIFTLGITKETLKVLLKQFYAEIYIDETENLKLYRNIQKKLRPVLIVSGLYVFTLFLYLVAAIVNKAVFNRPELMYKMVPRFDYTPSHIFYPTIFFNMWYSIIIVAMLVGELNMLAQMLIHINGRFLLLRDDIENCAQRLLKDSDPECIASEFQAEMKGFIARTVELYDFAAKIQNEFSYRIFVWFAFSAGLLCALGFKFYTNPSQSIAYACWIASKIFELTCIGELGSTLMKTTDETSSMFYHSKWELIIERSSNTRENIRLMKLILIAMETIHKPISLTGLNFFSVSLTAILTILQGAFSYFTFLISMR